MIASSFATSSIIHSTGTVVAASPGSQAIAPFVYANLSAANEIVDFGQFMVIRL